MYQAKLVLIHWVDVLAKFLPKVANLLFLFNASVLLLNVSLVSFV